MSADLLRASGHRSRARGERPRRRRGARGARAAGSDWRSRTRCRRRAARARRAPRSASLHSSCGSISRSDGEHERRMGEDVHRHVARERLERRHVRFHVRGRRQSPSGRSRWKTRKNEPFGQTDGVQRADAMREPTHDRRRDLTPQRVVPAELAAAQHVVLLEIVEILRDGARRIARSSARRARCGRVTLGRTPSAAARSTTSATRERAVGVRASARGSPPAATSSTLRAGRRKRERIARVARCGA